MDKPQMRVWYMHIACWILKAIDIHSKCVNNSYFYSAMKVAQTCLNIMLYVYCLSCFNSIGCCSSAGSKEVQF